MRLLVMSDRYPPAVSGGYEITCATVVDGLAARGHDVHVLTTVANKDFCPPEDHVHRDLEYMPFVARTGLSRRLAHLRECYWSRRNYGSVRRILGRLTPELVFVWNVEAASVASAIAAQDEGYRTVFSFGSHWLVQMRAECCGDTSAAKRLYCRMRLGFQSVEQLLVGRATYRSASLRDSYGAAGYDVTQATVIPNGLPDHWLAPHVPERRDRGMALLYVGRLEPAKGPETAIQALGIAAQRLNGTGVPLALDLIGTGDPDYVAYLGGVAQAMGIGEQVRFRGYVPREELPAYYSGADVFLFPTPQWEGFGTVVIEAMARGSVVVASDIGGPRDIVRSGRNGLLVPPADAGAMATAIVSLANDPQRRHRLATAALDTVRKEYRQETMIDRYESYLQSCV